MQKLWAVLFGVVLLASAGLFAIAPFVTGWWLPTNVCSFGPKTDRLFYLILGFTGFFFVLTEAVLVYAMWAYIWQPGQKALYTHGSHKLELLWTIVPAGILLFIAFAQVSVWGDIKYQSRMPPPDQVFEVSARQFERRIRYPNSSALTEVTETIKADNRKPGWVDMPHADDVRVVNEIHTWKNAKVRLYLKSNDVIHSFFLPNMRIKQDAMPGKIIPVWFDAEESNTHWDANKNEWVADPDRTWELACAELCGWGHYKMRGKIYVHESKADYERWLEQTATEANRTQP